MSCFIPADESPRLAGIPSSVDYCRLVEKDLREAARPRQPRRPDRAAYRHTLYPATWARSEIVAARYCEAYDREFARFPTRRL